jgi:hypothetical protein
MVARVVSTLGGVLSTRVVVASNPVGALQPVGVVLHAAAWGKEAAEEDMASMEVVDTKVLDILALPVILFKANQAGQQAVEILQMLEMRIGEDSGITTIIITVIIEQTMGTTNSDGLARIMWAEEELFSLVSEVTMMQ